MVYLKNIASSSIIGFVDTINNEQQLLQGIQYFKYNISWLSSFNDIVYSLNGNKHLCDYYINQIQSISLNHNIILLFSDNLNHTFGTFDNDHKIYQYASQNKRFLYVWKFSNDIIADKSILDTIIDNSYDFFYINNIGFAAFNNLTKEQLFENIKTQKYFYPQTNYYIYKNNIANWYPNYSEIIRLKNLFDEIKKDHPEYYPWDAISGCDCESMLAKTIIDNKLKPYHLLSDDDTKKIIEAVYNYRIGDGSHKNIQYSNIGNLCHYHFVNQPILKI